MTPSLSELCWFRCLCQDTNLGYDYMRIDFGVITNTGYRTGDDDDTIVLAFRAAVAASHSTVATGDSVTLAAGIRLGESTVWVGTVDVEVVSSITTTPEVSWKLTVSLFNFI